MYKNNKVVFVSYANERMAYSLKRIGKQARRISVIDDVQLYRPQILPLYVRNNPLMKEQRGGGYWCWKPAIIHETLLKYPEGTIVIYADAGCTLYNQNRKWERFVELMEKYDTLCFQYVGKYQQWEKWGTSSPQMRCWTKKNTLDYLQNIYPQTDVAALNQVYAGLLFFKGRDNQVLQQWKNMIELYPNLVTDPQSDEIDNQYPDFVQHRHDQSLLTPIANMDERTIILPEEIEQYHKNAFCFASRCRARNFWEYCRVISAIRLRLVLGNKIVDMLKNALT